MSVLSAVKSAVLRCDGAQIAEVVSSSEQIAVEMADLINEVAQDIAASHDWRDLTRIHAFPGGAASYPKPADYSRMLLDADMADGTSWLWGYCPFQSVNEWMLAQQGQWIGSPGGWIIMGGEFHFHPTPAGSASFPYISSLIVRDIDGALKSTFDHDDDEFILPERLLTLGLIWRWKEQKGLEYAEDQATYEIALAQAQGRDKGAYVVRAPRARVFSARHPYSGGQ